MNYTACFKVSQQSIQYIDDTQRMAPLLKYVTLGIIMLRYRHKLGNKMQDTEL